MKTPSLCGCNDAKFDGAKVRQMLNAAGDIAVEIQQAHKIVGHPAVRMEGYAARIELNVEDPDFDHQSVAMEVTKLKSIQSFQGSLHLIFVHRGGQPESEPPAMWVKYDARTGKQLKP